MTKKKDNFGQELKLTKKEKAEHKSRMKKFETISLYMIQIHRLLEMLYKLLIYLGKLVFPNKHLRQRLWILFIQLIAHSVWFILIPIVFQFIKALFTISTLENSFF